jgi:hypothetical protein
MDFNKKRVKSVLKRSKPFFATLDPVPDRAYRFDLHKSEGLVE